MEPDCEPESPDRTATRNDAGEESVDRTMPMDRTIPLTSTASATSTGGKRSPLKAKLHALLGTTSLGFGSRSRTTGTLDLGSLLNSGVDDDDTELEAGGTLPGEEFSDLQADFELKKVIAEGGQGRVSCAVDKKLRRVVAIKSLHEKLKNSNSSRGAFIAEARITGQLDHPAIIPVHGIFGDSGGGLHLSSKLIKGGTMKQYLEKLIIFYRRFSKSGIVRNEHKLLPQRIDMFLRACEAVSYAHHKRVIHRDLKPENIMIGSFGEIYVMDWGIAEHQTRKTFRGVPDKLLGTVQYIAPEVINSEPYDSRSDIYSLGLILFELVFLKRAYPAESLEEAIIKAQNGAVDSYVHAFGCRVDRDLKYIIRRALAPEPSARYQNVQALQNDLHNYLRFEAISAHPDNPFGKLLRVVRRHYLLMLLFCFVLLAVCLGGGAAFFVNGIRKKAEVQRQNAVFEEIYSRGVRAGTQFDSHFHSLEYLLASIVRESALLLENVSLKPRGEIFYGISPETGANALPADLQYSPAYHRRIALNEFVYKEPPGPRIPGLDALLQRLAPLRRSFFRAMIGSIPNSAGIPEEKEAAKETIRDRFRPPFSFVYISLRNGLHLCYPYHDNYAPEYDPRKRPWYRAAMDSPTHLPVWSTPYLDNGDDPELIVTCSRAIIDSTGVPLGVAGADISLSWLHAFLMKNGNQGMSVKNKYLVDREGRILVDNLGVRPDAEAKELRLFSSAELLEKMWLRKNGRLFSVEDDRRYLYFFQEIETVHWLYIERIDFMQMVHSRSVRHVQ